MFHNYPISQEGYKLLQLKEALTVEKGTEKQI
jgi:hypothetical protein